MRTGISAALFSLALAACVDGDNQLEGRAARFTFTTIHAQQGVALNYETYGKELSAATASRTVDNDVVMTLSPVPGGVEALTRRASDDEVGVPMKLSNGAIEEASEHPGPAIDLTASLPSANEVVLGKAYGAGMPPAAYLGKKFDLGHAVIWQTTDNVPTAIWRDGDAAVVRLDVTGNHTIFERELDGSISTSPLGVAYRARTHLLYTPASGWIVLDLHRVVDADIKEDPALIAFDALLAAPHSDFVACLDQPSALVSATLINAARRGTTICR